MAKRLALRLALIQARNRRSILLFPDIWGLDHGVVRVTGRRDSDGTGIKMGILHSVRIHNSLQGQAKTDMSVISSQAPGGADARLCYVLIDFVISVADLRTACHLRISFLS